mgnify:CR=1 FL=1
MKNTKIREQVMDDLKQYPELKKKAILLRYEQEPVSYTHLTLPTNSRV